MKLDDLFTDSAKTAIKETLDLGEKETVNEAFVAQTKTFQIKTDFLSPGNAQNHVELYEKYVDDVGSDNMGNFRTVWDSDGLDDDDKGAIWDWIELFINLSDKYYTKFGSIDGWEFDLEAQIEVVENMIKKYESNGD